MKAILRRQLPAALLWLAACAGADAPAEVDAPAAFDPDPGPGPDAALVADAPAPPSCPYHGPPLVMTDSFPECYQDAHCVPRDRVPAELQDSLAPCAGDLLCVPDPFIESLGSFVPPSCRSIAGVEGRCLSRALPSVAEQEDLMPQSDCAAHERCMPCYHPLTSEPTGACEIACDAPVEPPSMLPRCCHDLGTCLPVELVPTESAEKLGADTCGAGQLCAPDALREHPPALESCEPSLIGVLFGAQPGACAPDCLPSVEAAGFLLLQDGCPEHMKCAPCVSPTSGEPTGLCAP
jgi:hypothetical protein